MNTNDLLGFNDQESQGTNTNHLATYATYPNLDAAEPLLMILRHNNIPFQIEENKHLLNNVFVGDNNLPPYVLKINTVYFSEIKELVEASVFQETKISEDHYLFSFSEPELFRMLEKPDEWNIFDLAYAKRILIENGYEIDAEHLHNIKNQRSTTLQKGKNVAILRILFPILAILIGSAIITPLLSLGALGMAWYYWKDKSIDAEGLSYFSFDERTRRLGKFIFYGLVIVLIVVGVLAFLFQTYDINSLDIPLY